MTKRKVCVSRIHTQVRGSDESSHRWPTLLPLSCVRPSLAEFLPPTRTGPGNCPQSPPARLTNVMVR